MTLVTVAHNLTTESVLRQMSGRLPKLTSGYSYLFPDLADAERAKLPFTNSEDEYFEKLSKFIKGVITYSSASEKISSIPAVYTYFGQFINHDMSAASGNSHVNNGIITPDLNLIPLLSSNRIGTPQDLLKNMENQHAIPLSLNSLYAGGPTDVPSFYDAAKEKFLVKQCSEDNEMTAEERQKRDNSRKSISDIPRDKAQKIALICDQRNDENLIISQLHLAFMLFHNNAVDALKKLTNAKSGLALFAEARALVTKHYHWCIIHDYLEHIAPGQLAKSHGRIAQTKSVPLELTTAAFRFGHSQISADYNFNEVFEKASLDELFRFTSAQNMHDRTVDQLPNHWIIDWNRFLGEKPPSTSANLIDPIMTGKMCSLPDNVPDVKIKHNLLTIVARNILRGYHRFIPSGQALCQKIFKQDAPAFVLSPKAISDAFTPDANVGASDLKDLTNLCTPEQFGGHTPAWLYFLCEAKMSKQGNALGPTAGAIVTQTIEGLIKNVPNSGLSGGWSPNISPLRTPAIPGNGEYRDQRSQPITNLKTFLQFAGVVQEPPLP
jgi:Animal haem peroxidase